MTLTKDEKKELDDRNQRNALNKEIIFQLYRLTGLTTSKICKQIIEMSDEYERVKRFIEVDKDGKKEMSLDEKTFKNFAIKKFKNDQDGKGHDIRVRYFEIAVRKKTAPVDPLRLLAFFDLKSKYTLKLYRINTALTERNIRDGLIEFTEELKYPFKSLLVTQKLSLCYDELAKEGVNVEESDEPRPEGGIVVDMVLKNKESHQIAQEFSSADERDTFYKTLQKTIDTHNTKHSSKVIDIRNRFKPEKDNFTHQKLKVSQRVFECPENILESIYEYFKSGYYGEEVRTYLDGLSFKKDVNVINVHDMNVIKVELCQLFGSSVASSFTSSIASGIIFCNINGAEYEFALENLNKIIELDQDNSKEYYKYKAMIHDDLKNYQVALSYYEKSIGLFPAEAKREKIKYYARMFRINFSLEHYEDALECCKKAIELNESRNPNHNNKVPLIAKELDYYLGLAGLCTTLKPEKKDKFNEITQEFGAIYKIIAHEAESLEVITKSYAYNAPAYSPLTRIEKIHVVIKAYEIAIDLAINSSDYESAKKYTDEKNKLKNEWGDMRAFL